MERRAYIFTKLLLLTSALFLVIVPVVSSQPQQPQPQQPQGQQPQAQQPQAQEAMTGSISYIDGQLLRYSEDSQDWIDANKDEPFRVDDVLFCEENGKAEMAMPNGTLIRIDADTEIQLVTLGAELTEIDMDSGAGRFFNKSTNAVLKITTEFGDIVAPAGSTFDLYVDDLSLEVLTLKGRVDFVLEGETTKHEVIADAPSLLFDGKEMTKGEGKPDAKWDAWNLERDAALEKK